MRKLKRYASLGLSLRARKKKLKDESISVHDLRV